jgi:hypothetical protein
MDDTYKAGPDKTRTAPHGDIFRVIHRGEPEQKVLRLFSC